MSRPWMVDRVFLNRGKTLPHLWEFLVRSSNLNPASLFAAFLITCTISVPAWCAAPQPVAATTDSQLTRQTTTEQAPILLADEIIRRLRRLGLNFSKNRIPNPYSPYGEIC